MPIFIGREFSAEGSGSQKEISLILTAFFSSLNFDICVLARTLIISVFVLTLVAQRAYIRLLAIINI